MKQLAGTMAFVLIMTLILGCVNEEVRISSGTYLGEINAEDYYLYLDRTEKSGIFVSHDGQEIHFALENVDKGKWRDGCKDLGQFATSEEIVLTDLDVVFFKNNEIKSPQIRAGCYRSLGEEIFMESQDGPTQSFYNFKKIDENLAPGK